MLRTVEDCLEALAGLANKNYDLNIETNEYTIMNSIARQTFRGTALTDRQYTLAKEKLQKYFPQFTDVGLEGAELAVESLRQPLRNIDRSKYIKIVDFPEGIDIEETNSKFIAVRFPFKKTDIMLINEISNTDKGYYHNKGSHIHYFELSEYNLLRIGDKFFNKNFEIDEILKERYTKIKQIESTPKEYLPYVEAGKVINIKENLCKIIEQETNNDLLKIYDRRWRYCIEHINIKISDSSLKEKIVNRSDIAYQSKPSIETIDQILYALYTLDRFPMVVAIENKDCENQLYQVINSFRDLIDASEQSVLFREDDTDSGFNQLIKDRKLNNWVDKNTKVVYINNNKIPKLLLETEWKPNCAFVFNSNNNRSVQMYIKNNCDLIVQREETTSPFARMYL
jgi:hypothetical protein